MRHSTHSIRTREFNLRRDERLDRRIAQTPADGTEADFLALVFAALRRHLGGVIKQEAASGEFWGSGNGRYNLVLSHDGKELKVFVTTDHSTRVSPALVFSRNDINPQIGWINEGRVSEALVKLQRMMNSDGSSASATQTASTTPAAPAELTLMQRLGLTDDEPSSTARAARIPTLEELLATA